MSNTTFVQDTLTEDFVAIRNDLNQAQVATQMADIVRQLLSKGVKTVSVVGGAASGKSTIAEELVEMLQNGGTSTDMLCTDNYVVGDLKHRQTDLKDADAKEKYNFKLMDEHIKAIRQLATEDKTVAVPVIDAETGIAADADPSTFSHKVPEVDVLVIEGDFPRDDYDVRFYIHVPDDQRLQNNIDRETERNDDADPGQLTENFNARQRTLHRPYTLGALKTADFVLEADVDKDDWTYTLYQRVSHPETD